MHSPVRGGGRTMRCVTCLLGLLHVVLAFNLELRYPHVYRSDTPHDYFGFSVALHPGSRDDCDVPWMLVGAPRSNRSDVPNVLQPGRVLQCRLGEPCVPLTLETRRDRNEILDGGMLGSVQDLLGGSLVTCAPRMMDVRGLNAGKVNAMLGECFASSARNVATAGAAKIVPFRQLNRRGELLDLGYDHPNFNGITQPYFLYGEAGFSSHFTDVSQTRRDLVLGAPGVFNWQGSTVLYQGLNLQSKPIVPHPYFSREISLFGLFGYAVTSGRFFGLQTIYHVAGAPRSNSRGQVIIYQFPIRGRLEDTIVTKQVLLGGQTGEYFGSSLAAGKFNGDPLDDLVVGAPLYSDVQDEGRVYVYSGGSNVLLKPQEIVGRAPNGRFGTTVACVGDLDHDGFQDLAISAPYEGSGVVYIYNGGPGGVSARPSQRIEGSAVAPGSRGFGFSLSRGQDVDGNGYDDVAVGAYMSGHAVLLRARPVVKLSAWLNPILPEGKLARNSKHLGVNVCASYGGHLLPQHIDVVQRLELDVRHRRVFLGAGQNANQSVITLLSRDNPSFRDDCYVITLAMAPKIENYQDPINMKVTYELVPDREEYEPSTFSVAAFGEGGSSCNLKNNIALTSPVTREISPVVANAEVLFETQCGTNNICNSDLSVSLQFVDPQSHPISSFVVGSDDSLRALLTVTNSGEHPAYLARVDVALPSLTRRRPPTCTEQRLGNTTTVLSRLKCDVENPLLPGQKRVLEFQLDVGGLSASQAELQIEAVAFTSSQDQNRENDAATATLALTAEAGVAVSGTSGKELYVFNTKDHDGGPAMKNVPFRMRYKVEKYGISGVDEVSLLVRFPYGLKSGKEFLQLKQPEFLLNERPLSCVSDVNYLVSNNDVDSSATQGERKKRQAPDSPPSRVVFPSNRTLSVNCHGDSQWTCKQVQCVAGPFPNNRVQASLQLDMQLDVTLLEPLLGMRDIILFGTEVEATIVSPKQISRPPAEDRPWREEVIARFQGRIPEGRVDTWVIAVSVIGGVLLLLVLVTGLVKAGFFERKQKDALIKLKRETQMEFAAMQQHQAPLPALISDTEEDED